MAVARNEPTWGQRFALAVGAVFLIVGILGFVPGVTQDLGDIQFAGHHSDAQLLGIFEVSVLHNIVHLLFGVAGLVAARRADLARSYLFIGGAIYLVLAAYGALTEHESSANFVPVDSADDLLHLGLGLGMIVLGAIALGRERTDDDLAGRPSTVATGRCR
ncbi:MAG: DUF4383 domain-containing protein [Aquihabitans sp.]